MKQQQGGNGWAIVDVPDGSKGDRLALVVLGVFGMAMVILAMAVWRIADGLAWAAQLLAGGGALQLVLAGVATVIRERSIARSREIAAVAWGESIRLVANGVRHRLAKDGDVPADGWGVVRRLLDAPR